MNRLFKEKNYNAAVIKMCVVFHFEKIQKNCF